MLTTTEYAVHVSNLVVAAKLAGANRKVLLSGINFDLETGKFIGVIGPLGLRQKHVD